MNKKTCLNVTRPGKWGNPFHVRWSDFGYCEILNGDDDVIAHFDKSESAQVPVFILECYEEWLDEWISNGAPIHELRGKNLACFCRVGEPCHREILLRKANL